nr:hypothetical protein [Tanacetum cinerariifolium]
ESDTKNVYDDPFDSKGEKIKESKLFIDKLDLPCDFLLPFKYDSFLSVDFSKVDALPLTNNEDKDFSRDEDFPSPNNEDKPDFHKPDEDFSCSMWKEYSSFGCSSVPFLSPLIHSSMGEFGPAHRPTSASWEAPHAYQYFSIPGNLKTLANGFCTQVFISSV